VDIRLARISRPISPAISACLRRGPVHSTKSKVTFAHAAIARLCFVYLFAAVVEDQARVLGVKVMMEFAHESTDFVPLVLEVFPRGTAPRTEKADDAVKVRPGRHTAERLSHGCLFLATLHVVSACTTSAPSFIKQSQ
jgi:hypothetical protein